MSCAAPDILSCQERLLMQSGHARPLLKLGLGGLRRYEPVPGLGVRDASAVY